MGHFYTNITLKGAGQRQTANWLARERRAAVVSPPAGPYVVVYDVAGERQDGSVFDLAERLSAELACAALAVMNHDDSVLSYCLFDRGMLADEYNSSPDYFGERPPQPQLRGNADVLCRILGRPEAAPAVAAVLAYDKHAPDDDGRYTWEVQRHADLVEALGLPETAVGIGAAAIADGAELPGLALTECLLTDEAGRILE